ncbi:hypothetical protein HB364_29425 [Pseudoflavitalea sp. X16]|uniref:hypothetical protein n=1 Tax=Paraflavitalea devenefica TaxID=2716334 RepID=UPI00141FBFE3|nr:hypothetical protein [Paraflavitalea devenefica]NII29237.1 hypothetical protein [Paraflavitalea devenefica]
MKQQRTNKMWIALQALVLTCIAGFAIFGLLSFKAMNRYADFWGQLGVSKERGTASIKESFLGGYFYYSGRNVKNILAGDRTAVAKDLLAYTKEYVNTEAFAKDYETSRQWSKPVPPEAAKTEAVIRQKFIDDAKKGIGNLEQLLKTTTDASMKKSVQNALEQTKQSLKDYEDPNSQMIKLAVQGEQNQYNWRLKDYEDKLKSWEEHTPAGVKALIKVRLQQLLKVTNDVDFNAQLTERYGKKVFVNREYEGKPSEWKMAFRAGKEVTNAVRAFATEWLKEVQ